MRKWSPIDGSNRPSIGRIICFFTLLAVIVIVVVMLVLLQVHVANAQDVNSVDATVAASTHGGPNVNVDAQLAYTYMVAPDGAKAASNIADIWTEHGWRPSLHVGRLVFGKNGVGLKLITGEKFISAYAEYDIDGAEPYSIQWNGKSALPYSFMSARGDEQTLTRVFVYAILSKHPPYRRIRLK